MSFRCSTSWRGLLLLSLLIVDRAEADDRYSVVAVLHHKKAFDRPHDIELMGDLAIVPGKAGSVAVVSIADAFQPELLWWQPSPEETDDAQTVLPWNGHVMLGSRDFYSIDLAQPRQPKFVKKISSRQRIDRINGMARIGDFVFTANKHGYVSLFDCSDPNSPVHVGSLDTRKSGGIASPHDIAAWGHRIIVVDQRRGSRLKARVYRVADQKTGKVLPPEEWQVEGSIADEKLDGANRVNVSPPYAFIGCNHSDTLASVDLSDPQQPQLLAVWPFADIDPCGQELVGKLLISAGGQAVELFDVSNPAEPQSLLVCKSDKVFPTGRDNAHDVVYRDGLIYVTCQNDHQIGIFKIHDSRILRLARDPISQK